MKYLIIIIVILGLIHGHLKDPFVKTGTNKIKFGYVIKHSGDVSKKDKLPMIIALHGNGDKAKNFYKYVLSEFNYPARIILIKAPISQGLGSAWPWTAEHYAEYGTAFNEAVQLILKRYHTKGKPILFGFSGGGSMALYESVKHGDSYSTIVSVAGRLSADMAEADNLKIGAKVILFHGKSDDLIPLSAGRNAVKTLKAHRVDAELKELNGGHHIVFNNTEEILLTIEEVIKNLSVVNAGE